MPLSVKPFEILAQAVKTWAQAVSEAGDGLFSRAWVAIKNPKNWIPVPGAPGLFPIFTALMGVFAGWAHDLLRIPGRFIQLFLLRSVATLIDYPVSLRSRVVTLEGAARATVYCLTDFAADSLEGPGVVTLNQAADQAITFLDRLLDWFPAVSSWKKAVSYFKAALVRVLIACLQVGSSIALVIITVHFAIALGGGADFQKVLGRFALAQDSKRVRLKGANVRVRRNLRAGPDFPRSKP